MVRLLLAVVLVCSVPSVAGAEMIFHLNWRQARQTQLAAFERDYWKAERRANKGEAVSEEEWLGLGRRIFSITRRMTPQDKKDRAHFVARIMRRIKMAQAITSDYPP